MSDLAHAVLSFFDRRRTAYRLTFNKVAPAVQMVLADLQDFCAGNETTMRSNDPLELARNEGRRQVWLRIQRAINLTPEEQFDLARKKDKPQ